MSLCSPRRTPPATLAALADVQLCFDYAIARTDPPLSKVEASVATLKAIVK
jgi:hypothetical protein